MKHVYLCILAFFGVYAALPIRTVFEDNIESLNHFSDSFSFVFMKWLCKGVIYSQLVLITK